MLLRRQTFQRQVDSDLQLHPSDITHHFHTIPIQKPSGVLLNDLFSTTGERGDHGSETCTLIYLNRDDGARLPMVSLITINWIIQAKKKVNLWFASTTTPTTFLQLNAVIFTQYYVCFASFPLTPCEHLSRNA